jgi:Pectinesterase/MBG domain/Bacterial Ig-like domain/Carboxypeptidase regulatory-like domain/Immunoglobulin domain
MNRPRTLTRILIAITLCVAAFFAINFFVQASTVIDDQFADGISTNQNLGANSLQVFKSRSGTTRTDAVGSVEYDLTTTGASADAYFAYFTASGSPVNLSVGDSLTFAGTFTLTGFGGTGQDIRFGLFNSNASRATIDLTGGNSTAAFGDDTGYAAQFVASPAGSGTPFVLYRRDVASPVITNIFNTFGAGSGFTVIPGTGATVRQALTNATPYTLSYTVTRLSATQTQVTMSVTGGTLSGLNFTGTETSATPYTAFDWFDFRIPGSTLATKVKFTRIKVDYTPAAPVITTPPSPLLQTVAAGSNTGYSVGASGVELAYQWYKDNAPITGNATATTANLALNNVLPADAGEYKVTVTNPGGSATSDPVTLNISSGPVDPPPVINQSPVDTIATVGTPADLTVSATGLNLQYQWYKGGNIMGGENSPTLHFNAVTPADDAIYTVNVSNGGGTVPSDPAHLTVVSAMSSTAFSPANNSSGRCTDTNLAITFNQAPQVGTSGKIRIYRADTTLIEEIDMANAAPTRIIGGNGTPYRYFPIIAAGSTATIYPKTPLAVGQTYYVTIEPGAIKDPLNLPFAGFNDSTTWRFTTKATNPAASAANLTVAADNSGDFCTVQGAIDNVPASNTVRRVITVKTGTYTEIVYIPSSKPLITIRGEDRANSIVQYSNNNSLNGVPTGNNRTSFGVDAADFTLETITLHNTTPQGGSQAEALRTNGLRATINSVNLLSYQDTLLTQKSAFITNSYIEGDVDFMWGNGSTYFKDTELKALRNAGYYTQIRNISPNAGNTYVNCRLTKGVGITSGNYLGRIDPDDFPFSQALWIDTRMDTHMAAVGWLFNNPGLPETPASYPNIKYCEYNSTALDGVTPIDVSSRHPISCQLSAVDADFWRIPANTLGGWAPDETLTGAVTLSDLNYVYDGASKSATVTTAPSGLTVDVTYNGSPTLPVNAGSYTVSATVTTAGYHGSATGTLVISPAAATVTLSNLTQDYDGTPKAATVTTSPPAVSTAVTYSGSATVPSAIGNYTVLATVSDPNYAGSATGNLNIRSTVKAFPEAEGTGAYTVGGRGGDIYHVTNLNDAGAGSLREGIATATGPRTIVFDLSGTIYLDSRLVINKPFITLAGQTAPGDGITVAGWTTVVDATQHVVIRYMRFRGGDIRCANGMEGDALWVDNSRDVIVDHVSASWSIDESLSVTDSDRVTIQWSMITESLNNSCHPEGRHGFGSLIRYGSGKISYHHNLYAHHNNRNPRVGDNITLDFVNNVIYDWGTDASYSGPVDEGITKVNYVGNYLVAGPNTPANKRNRAFNGGSPNTWIYQTGNLIDSNVNGVKDGADTGWAMFVNLYTQQASPLSRSSEPAAEALPDIAADTAQAAYNKVTTGAGHSQHRDAVDTRILSELQNETGAFIDSQNQVGGFPALNSQPPPADTDGDGIPNLWEISHGLNPNDPGDGAALSGNGYTNLENYLNRNLFAPTAAGVTISGRVTNASGNGILKAKLTLSTNTGEVYTALTNPLGYFSFENVPAGTSCLLTVSSKRYRFGIATRVVNVEDSLTDVNFVANE